MSSGLKFYLFSMIVFCFGTTSFIDTKIDDDKNKLQEIQVSEIIPSITKKQKEKSIDEITLKQQEMRDTIVLIQTRRGSGSGTIIDRLDTDKENIFEYRILTNAHVTRSRFITYLRGVNSITGKTKTETIDTGCRIISFNHQDRNWDNHKANVVLENIKYDLAILSFLSNKELVVAKIADVDMLEQVRVFDEVFAVGCQLGRVPSPTIGIISQISIGVNNEQEWIIYGNTSQIILGSSGGGLFKKYDDHYYLIGIPYRIAITHDGQLVPHLSYAISILTARNFINQTLVTYP